MPPPTPAAAVPPGVAAAAAVLVNVRRRARCRCAPPAVRAFFCCSGGAAGAPLFCSYGFPPRSVPVPAYRSCSCPRLRCPPRCSAACRAYGWTCRLLLICRLLPTCPAYRSPPFRRAVVPADLLPAAVAATTGYVAAAAAAAGLPRCRACRPACLPILPPRLLQTRCSTAVPAAPVQVAAGCRLAAYVHDFTCPAGRLPPACLRWCRRCCCRTIPGRCPFPARPMPDRVDFGPAAAVDAAVVLPPALCSADYHHLPRRAPMVLLGRLPGRR